MSTAPPPPYPDGLAPEFEARFELTRQLGAGSFGAVFQARDRQLERDVVIKVLRLEAAQDPTLVERFRREAEAMAHLAHPRVVPLLDHGRSGSCHYLIAPDLGGRSLEEELRGRLPLPPGEAVAILEEILEGLAAIHGAELVHRDLKLANVLRLEDGHLALIDLGLAAVEGAGGTLTATGEAVGTPAYMAPEHLRAGVPVASGDLYAVGVLAYELLTGENPFLGLTPGATLQNHLTLEPTPPHEVDPRVPRKLSSWVLDLLEKDPDDRPSSAAAARGALLQARRGAVLPRASRPDGSHTQGAARSRGGPSGSGAALGALVTLLGLGVGAWWLTRPVAPPPAPPDPAPTGLALPRELSELAIRELEGAYDTRVDGAPLLATDPARWGECLRHLTVPSRFYAWLRAGGRPEDLPDEHLRSLRAVDSSYRALGFPAPFGPFLAGADAAAVELRAWPSTTAVPETPAPLLELGPLPGWLAEAHETARRLEALRQERAAELRRALTQGDASAGPAGFLAKWRLLMLARSDPVPARVLGTLSLLHVSGDAGRRALVEWLGDGPAEFRRLGYCLARAVRDQPEESERAALLYQWWAQRFRVFTRAHVAHAPLEFGLGFVPEGPQGASLALALLRQAVRCRIQLHGQELPWGVPERTRRALVPPSPTKLAAERFRRAATDALASLGTVGQATRRVVDVVALRDLVARLLEARAELPRELLHHPISFAVVTYEKILRVAAGEDWERAREDLAALAPGLLAVAPELEDTIQEALSREGPQLLR